jgi:hypothetical protein
MSENPQAQAPQQQSGIVGRTLGWAWSHPKTSMLAGAGLAAFAGAELIAAGLVGGFAVAFLGVGRKSEAK